MDKIKLKLFVDTVMYATCPECGKRISLSRLRFRRHYRNNGSMCVYSGEKVQGLGHIAKSMRQDLMKMQNIGRQNELG